MPGILRAMRFPFRFVARGQSPGRPRFPGLAARPRLVLHVGPHKTGSTAIQEHCTAHRDALEAAGYWYPRAGTWLVQHAALPATLIRRHVFLPPSMLGGDPEAVLDEIAREVPRGFVTVLSSEVFWELLMFLPEPAARLLGLLDRRYRMTVLMFDRPEESRAWSSIKHMTRAGLAVDASVMFARDLRLNRAAADRLAAAGCRTARIPYTGQDVVEAFLQALPAHLGPVGRLLDGRARIARLVDERRRSRKDGKRENAAPTNPRAAAFAIEFSRRLAAKPAADADARARIAQFMAHALTDARATGPWEALPDERTLRERTIAAKGRPGCLLTPAEAEAWEGARAQQWLAHLAERLGCLAHLEQVRHQPPAGSRAEAPPLLTR